jgi:hypothetical protein
MTTASVNFGNDVANSVESADRAAKSAHALRLDKERGLPVEKSRLDALSLEATKVAAAALGLAQGIVVEVDRKEIDDAAREADVSRVRRAHANQLVHLDELGQLKLAVVSLRAALDELQKAVADPELAKALAVVDGNHKAVENALAQAKQAFDASVRLVGELAPFLAVTGGVGPLGTLSTRSDRIRPVATTEQAFWSAIRASQLSFKRFDAFMSGLCEAGAAGYQPKTMAKPMDDCSKRSHTRARRVQAMLPFPGVDQYRQLRAAAEVFLLTSCTVVLPDKMDDLERERLGAPETFGLDQLRDRFEAFKTEPQLQYLRLLADRVGNPRQANDVDDPGLFACLNDVATMKLECPCLIELIWSYWLEEGMQVQAINAIGLRFQNRRVPGLDGLSRMHVDPLRPLNSLLWGYIQDEQHRLTIARRAYEYDHHYGITLAGKAVPVLSAADSRSKFLEAFHNLLHVTAKYYVQADNTQIIADAFPVLNALREVHQLLTDGGDNQWGDLPWTSRVEMLVQQWILARPEMESLFPGRVTTVYDERWMRVVDAVKSAQGWTDTSVTHFFRLATYGELLLLSVRFFPWSLASVGSAQAANWALYFRNEIQGYLHAYRSATGVDLAAAVDARPPSQLLLARLASTGT